ncbi:hypothetical protein LXL04_004658 [Taraxacum kok-saghyz]
MVTAIKSRKNNKKIMLIEMSWSMETITLRDKRIGIKTGVLEENITQIPSAYGCFRCPALPQSTRDLRPKVIRCKGQPKENIMLKHYPSDSGKHSSLEFVPHRKSEGNKRPERYYIKQADGAERHAAMQ